MLQNLFQKFFSNEGKNAEQNEFIKLYWSCKKLQDSIQVMV